MSGHITHRTHHFIGDYGRAFTVVIQHKRLKGHANLDILKSDKEVCARGYVYCAIATNRETIKASDLQLFDSNDLQTMNKADAPDPSAWCIHSKIHAALPRIKVLLHCQPAPRYCIV